jgi:VanZ family protein
MAVIAAATTVPLPRLPISRTELPYDKLAHLVLYLGLGWALARGTWRSGARSARAVLLAFGAGVAFAAADEWHQALVPTRVPQVSDWLVDVAGVSLGLVLYVWPRSAAGRREADRGRAAG